MKTIDRFDGPYRFLSNFYPSPIVADGHTWPTVEHLYQAMKTRDPDEARRIREAKGPGEAKRLGRRIAHRHPGCDWESVKLIAMGSCLTLKFDQNADLRRKLLLTGDANLVEGNTWGDVFWGVCEGQGKNYLGRLLMVVRTAIRDAQQNDGLDL